MMGGLIAAAFVIAPVRPVTAETTGASAQEARVSTSPEDHASAKLSSARAPRAMRVVEVEDEPPLTRAAARRRVETMSPARWLEHFGPVTVERHE